MREIPLTRGLVALVDDADFDWLNQWKWRAGAPKPGRYYASRQMRVRTADKVQLVHVYMHRAVLNAPAGVIVDHADRNTLNNCRGNLRLASPRESSRNAVKPTATGLRGAVLNHKTGRYYSRIRTAEGMKWLGYYPTAEAAAHAYDAAAREHHGAFAVLNFPDEAVS